MQKRVGAVGCSVGFPWALAGQARTRAIVRTTQMMAETTSTCETKASGPSRARMKFLQKMCRGVRKSWGMERRRGILPVMPTGGRTGGLGV